MSTRPERRKSQLAGASPVEPATVTPIAAVPEPVEPAAKPRRNAAWSQVSIRLHPEDADRLRGAVEATRSPHTYRSLNEFVSQVVMNEVSRLEQEHNSGKPWDGVTAGDLTPGRRPSL
ncbi:MAG: ParB family protein [Actinomycetota bacterium]